jgi:ATP-binding cassette subfamily F protein 3
MIANITIHEKSFGSKVLYKDLALQLQPKEKVGLIGRNGTGKSTLFHMLTGDDKDFSGTIQFRKNLIIIASRQEHQELENTPVLEYILDGLPQYAALKHILDTFPETMGNSTHKMNQYGDALEQFSSLGYYQVESEIVQTLEKYQLNETQINGTIGQLSGGQKRFVELVKVQHANAELVLIDEPTNHMDYVAKNSFVEWFKQEQASVLVITHDRDVLRQVDRIIELRDGRAISFTGNYDDYLRTNTTKIVSEVNEYEVTQSRITNLKADVIRFQRLKERSRDPDTIKRFKGQEQRARTELAKLGQLEKPSFWIDQDSLQGLNDKLADSYDAHKARNIRVRMKTKESSSSRLLIEAHELSLGYDTPLFESVSFQLREGERLRLHGRNGAGKTTLIQAILAQADGTDTQTTKYAGRIATEKELKIGVYQQEIDAPLLKLTLHDAVEKVLLAKGVSASEQRIRQLLSDYLFNPMGDANLTLERLSGGQKARYQLISMLCNDPQILILDEPTNHLDLPSIEELENALKQYHGAIIYVSHDSYFAGKLQGTEVKVG